MLRLAVAAQQLVDEASITSGWDGGYATEIWRVRTKAPLPTRRVADTAGVARQAPIRRVHGRFGSLDLGGPPEFDALLAAVRLSRRPGRAAAMRAAPVPKGVLLLFQILSKLEEPTALAVRQLNRDPTAVRVIAGRYVEQVLFAGDPDAYRVLGLERDASQEEVFTHLEAAQAWLEPYVGTFRWEDEMAAVVAAAGQAIGTLDDRIAYDQAAWRHQLAASSGYLPLKRVRRRRPFMFALVAISWFGLMSGNFLDNEPAGTARVAGLPAISGATEADPSIDVVRVKVVKGVEAPATAKAPMVPPMETWPTETRTQPDFNAAFPAPDFATAFMEERRVPAAEVAIASVAGAEDAAAPPALNDASPASDLMADASETVPDPDVTASTTASTSKASAAAAPPVSGQTKSAPPLAESVVDEVEVAALPAPSTPPEPTATTAPIVVVSPSFKCSRAFTDTEVAICDDPVLAAKDRELADLFREVRGPRASATRTAATNAQQSWLKVRDACRGSRTCILDAYEARISELAVKAP